jgi:hypothetical protein
LRPVWCGCGPSETVDLGVVVEVRDTEDIGNPSELEFCKGRVAKTDRRETVRQKVRWSIGQEPRAFTLVLGSRVFRKRWPLGHEEYEIV